MISDPRNGSGELAIQGFVVVFRIAQHHEIPGSVYASDEDRIGIIDATVALPVGER